MEIKFFDSELAMLAFYNANKRFYCQWLQVDTDKGFALSFKIKR